MIKDILKLARKEYFINNQDLFFVENSKIYDCKSFGKWSSPIVRYIENKKIEVISENINSILAISNDKKRVLKLELNPHPRKSGNLADEANILKTLNEKTSKKLIILRCFLN